MTSAAEEYNVRLTLGVVISVLILSTVSFVLRIWARFSTGAKLWWDDYWMFWVMFVCALMSTFDLLGLRFGSGKHQADLPKAEATTFVKLLWIYMLLWATGVFSVKIGILLFYWRIFQKTPKFRVAAIAVAFFSTGIFLSNFFSFTFQCIPVQKFWLPDTDGACFDQNAFYLSSAVINVVGDIAVLALPLPIIWKLQASRSKKWSLSFLFLLGAFVVFASVFRIVAVTQIDPHDFSFTNVGGGLWSTVEVEVGFICANLPAVRPLVFRFMGWGATENGSGSPNYNLSNLSATPKLQFGRGPFHMHSKGRDAVNDLDDSSTEALTEQSTTRLTKTKHKFEDPTGNRPEPMPLSDIVVQRDFNMSVNDPQNAIPAGVQISTAHNQIHIPGVGNSYYGSAR
ncbi:hypothetical protein GGR57DRAFT_509759 [Xylariaceae sp. FL1272]|nr:hypothetical protein GGR57DRAFT_509759 [Xylariaceae sp. FL1272]